MAGVVPRLGSHPVLALVAVGIAAAGLLLVALAAWLLAGLIRQAAEERLQPRVTFAVRVERVSLNVFTGRARVSNISVGAGDRPPILTLPALDLGVSYRGLLRGRLVLQYLTFDRPRVFIERTGSESVARLASVIEFLKDHPRLALQLRGVANPEEAEPLKRERLREALKKTPPAPDEPLVAVYLDAGGPAAKSPPPAREMEQFVLDHNRIGPDDLQDLAAERARVIQEALVRQGVEARRLYAGRAEERAVQDSGLGRVEFELLY